MEIFRLRKTQKIYLPHTLFFRKLLENVLQLSKGIKPETQEIRGPKQESNEGKSQDASRAGHKENKQYRQPQGGGL